MSFVTHSKDENLVDFPLDCRDFDGFVTFFGGGFDLPVLSRRFPPLGKVFADRLHVDLCPLMKRLGHTGGLKAIERRLDINRSAQTDGLTGWDAVRLWRAWQGGGSSACAALDTLVAYNSEDVVNLAILLEYALPRLKILLDLPA